MKSRQLTLDEIHLAKSIFGQEIDYSRVKICAVWWILKGYAMSPNGNIYFNAADFVADFSKTSVAIQAWFIHEMVHVWQYQQGVKVLRRAWIDRRYAYTLTEGKNFLEYGLEQQAMMVQHFFLQNKNGQSCDALKSYLPFKVDQMT